MLTIRSTCGSPVATWRVAEPLRPRRPAGRARSSSTCPAPPVAVDHGPGPRRVRPAGAGRVELARRPGSRCSRGRRSRRATRPVRAPASVWSAPIGCQPWAIEPAIAPRLHGDRPVPAPVRPEEGLARRLEPGDRAPSTRTRRSGRGARGTRSRGRRRRPRRGPRRSTGCAGSSWRRPGRPRGRTRRRRTATAAPASGRSLVTRVRQTSSVSPGRHEVRSSRRGCRRARPSMTRVPEAVPAAVVVELALGRLPARVPVVAGVVVADVQEAAAHVERGVVVAVADQPPQPGVAEERVAAGGVGDEREVVLAARGS